MEQHKHIQNAELNRFRAALQWRDLILTDPMPDDAEQVDKDLLAVLDNYSDELGFRLGKTQPYFSDLHRLGMLKDQVSRKIDPIMNEMAERADGKPLPPFAKRFCMFLGEIVLDCAWVIRAIEAQHPELTEFFKRDRESYARLIQQPLERNHEINVDPIAKKTYWAIRKFMKKSPHRNSVFINDHALCAKVGLKQSQLGIMLGQLREAGFIQTRQGNSGCHYSLPKAEMHQ